MEPVPWPTAFDESGWLWQLKWDGVRCLACVDRDGVRLWSRHGTRRTERYPEIEGLLPAATGGRPAVLDGEIVALDPDGRPNFHLVMRRAMQAAPSPSLLARVPVAYVVFDALAWEGDVRDRPVEQRLELLREGLRPADHVRLVQTQSGGGVALVAGVTARGLEGAVAKRVGSRYVAGPSGDWRKIKPRRRLEALIVGHKNAPGGSLRSLALAVEVGGALVYVGDAGSGLTEAVRARLREVCAGLPEGPPPQGAPRAARSTRWVVPRLTAQVSYAELTPQGMLRAPVITGFGAARGPV